MKVTAITLILLNLSFTHAQNLYEFEKPIDGLENYIVENITFKNEKDNILLSGSLILPREDYHKIIIIIPGTGKDKRNSHYKLTKALLDKSIGVLRYDDRGVGESQGNYKTTKIKDFAEDLKTALIQLKKLFPNKKIGSIGHSLGAQIVLEANKSLKQETFDFMVILAGAVVNGKEISLHQAKDYSLHKFYQLDDEPKDSTLKYLNHIIDIIYLGQDKKSIKKEIIKYSKETGLKKVPKKYYGDYYIDVIKNDPSNLYKNVDIPMFYIIGSKDRRTPTDLSIKKLQAIANKNIEILILEDMSHYFTDNPYFYEIEPVASDVIVNWILKQD